MRYYVLKRIGQAVLVLWAAYTLAYLLLSALPGDAVNNRIQNPDALITPEAAQIMLDYYGLDRPVWQQYLSGLVSALHGDLGYSLTNGVPVTTLIGDALPSTLALTGLALVIGVVLAVVIGLAINYAPSAALRNAFGSAPALFASVPTFVIGILALQFLSFKVHLIPSSDDGSFVALLAPAATLGIFVAAPLAQVFGTSIHTTRRLPFVHVLHARGASEGYIFRNGILRNCSIPVLTLLGLACGELIAGSVVTETVFARAGLGQLTVSSVSTQDLPVVQGVVLVATIVYVTVNLLVDLAYPFIDARILVDGKTPRVNKTRARRAEVTPVAVPVPAPTRPRLPVEVAMP